jgi:hypothetical protein
MTLNGLLLLLFFIGDSRISTLDSAFTLDHGSSVDCELLPLPFILGHSRALTLNLDHGISHVLGGKLGDLTRNNEPFLRQEDVTAMKGDDLHLVTCLPNPSEKKV